MGGKRWSAGEDQLLKENYAKTLTNKLVGMVNRSKYSVYHRAIYLGLESKKRGRGGRRWSIEEVRHLEKSYESMSVADIAKILNRPICSVHHKARSLGLRSGLGGRGKKWRAGEIDFLRENYKCMPPKRIAQTLNRSVNSVELKARKLELNSKRWGIGERWNKHQADFLKRNYGSISCSNIAQKLGKTIASIHGKAGLLGIRHSREKGFDNRPTPALSYILGVLYGDGCCELYEKIHRYCVHLNCTDKEFSESFALNLQKIGLHPYIHITNVKYPNAKTRWNVDASSKPFCYWFKSLMFETIWTFLKTKEMKREFIRGFYESEGTLHKIGKLSTKKYYDISIVNTDWELVKFVQKITSDLGFSFSLTSSHPNRRSPAGKLYKRLYKLYLLGGFTGVVNFLTEIKPVIWRKSIEKIKKENPEKLGRYFLG